MSSDIVLTAALRNNLLSLQNTQRLIDQTQLRLATGLKVNSALDNPQNYFTSEALNNRAADLTRLLDGIGQSIRTIEEANTGVTALSSLVNQAQSVINSARDELAASEGEARVLGTVDLSEVSDLTSLGSVTANDVLTFRVVNDSGSAVSENITIVGGETGASLAAKITDAFADNQNGEITARLTDQGFLEIKSVDGRSFRILDADSAGGNDLALAGLNSLGIGAQFEVETDGAGATSRVAATVLAGDTISSISLYEGTGDLAEAGDLLTGTYEDSEGTTVLSGFAAGDSIAISVNHSNGSETVTLTLTAASTFQSIVDAVNVDSTGASTDIADYIELEFDSLTGQLNINKLSDDIENVEFSITSANATITSNLGFGDPDNNVLDTLSVTNGNTGNQTFTFGSGNNVLDDLASDYNTIREQIDDLVADAEYRGINLLSGDDLVTNFNEDRSSTLTTSGADFTSAGLGLLEAFFTGSDQIEESASQVDAALEEIRSFGTTLANNLSVIQTRRDFTEGTINTLESGADDLVVADQNEEGANLLALQTRQALGTTSLSLASQSQQSVLRLF